MAAEGSEIRGSGHKVQSLGDHTGGNHESAMRGRSSGRARQKWSCITPGPASAPLPGLLPLERRGIEGSGIGSAKPADLQSRSGHSPRRPVLARSGKVRGVMQADQGLHPGRDMFAALSIGAHPSSRQMVSVRPFSITRPTASRYSPWHPTTEYRLSVTPQLTVAEIGPRVASAQGQFLETDRTDPRCAAC